MSLSRRQFLKTAGVLSATVGLRSVPSSVLAQDQPAAPAVTSGTSTDASAPAAAKRWYRGNLHMHTRWSDGSALPETAIDIYRQRGYNYLCVSDHNNLQTDDLRFTGSWFNDTPKDKTPFEGETSTWRVFPERETRLIEDVQKRFGKDAVTIKTVEGKRYVRLTPLSELKQKFEQPGEFLLIPGFEQTGQAANQMQVHMNFINVPAYFPYIQSYSPLDTFYENYQKGVELYGKNPEPYLFTLNHPCWIYYDVSPEVLKQLHMIRFFELGNNPVSGGPFHEKAWTPEKFWDVVNAFRCANGHQLLYATGSDDTHSYLNGSADPCTPFFAWDVVRADQLTVPALLAAMNAGDYYVSTGIALEDIHFDAATRTLSVRVQPEEGFGPYKIEFFGTKKTFNRHHEVLEITAPQKRTLDVYSDEVGVLLKTVEGLEGSYTLADDDLYVRARVTLSNPQLVHPIYPVYKAAAFTQPYRVEGK